MKPDVIAPIVRDGVTVGWMFFCPACKCGHSFAVQGDGPHWTFNNDTIKPTFAPSLRCTWGASQNPMCHSFVRNGRIEFCGDCTHSLAGQTVDLQPIEGALSSGAAYNYPQP